MESLSTAASINSLESRCACHRKTSSKSSKPPIGSSADCSLSWLVHGFSTRPGGVSTCYGGKSLNLGITPQDTHANVERNRELYREALGAVNQDGSLWPLAQVRQIHSAIIHRIERAVRPMLPPATA